jgi:hypothetical protein
VLAIRIAEAISAVTRLPVLAVPLFLAVGVAAAGREGALWALLCLFLTSGVTLAYLYYLVRRGVVRNPRTISRAERISPLRVVAGIHAGAFAIVVLLEAPEELQAVLLSYAIATLLLVLLTPFTNPSLHAAGISGAAVCVSYVFGAWGVPVALLLPPVWWARTRLDRHTPLELGLGAIIGTAGTWVAFELLVVPNAIWPPSG